MVPFKWEKFGGLRTLIKSAAKLTDIVTDWLINLSLHFKQKENIQDVVNIITGSISIFNY